MSWFRLRAILSLITFSHQQMHQRQWLNAKCCTDVTHMDASTTLPMEKWNQGREWGMMWGIWAVWRVNSCHSLTPFRRLTCPNAWKTLYCNRVDISKSLCLPSASTSVPSLLTPQDYHMCLYYQCVLSYTQIYKWRNGDSFTKTSSSFSDFGFLFFSFLCICCHKNYQLCPKKEVQLGKSVQMGVTEEMHAQYLMFCRSCDGLSENMYIIHLHCSPFLLHWSSFFRAPTMGYFPWLQKVPLKSSRSKAHTMAPPSCLFFTYLA